MASQINSAQDEVLLHNLPRVTPHYRTNAPCLGSEERRYWQYDLGNDFSQYQWKIPHLPADNKCGVVRWKDRLVLHQHDVGVFWDLRRYHLGHDVVSVESVVLALKYRAGLIKSFCNHWLGLDGLNALVRFAVVCDLPGGGDAALELQRQKIFQAFDDLEMQFSNVGGTNNPSRARREGIGRFVKQFVDDYPRPFLVVISDELPLLQSVRDIVGEAVIVPVISRYYKRGHQTDGLTRHFYNRILANNIVVHPWDVYFYEVIMATQIKGHRYPRNVLQILYSKKRDTGTLKEPLIAWVLSLVLQSAAVHLFYRYRIFEQSP